MPASWLAEKLTRTQKHDLLKKLFKTARPAELSIGIDGHSHSNHCHCPRDHQPQGYGGGISQSSNRILFSKDQYQRSHAETAVKRFPHIQEFKEVHRPCQFQNQLAFQIPGGCFGPMPNDIKSNHTQYNSNDAGNLRRHRTPVQFI